MNWNKFLEKNPIDIQLPYQLDRIRTGKDDTLQNSKERKLEPKIPAKAVIKHENKKENKTNKLKNSPVIKGLECLLYLEKSVWENPSQNWMWRGRGELDSR